MKKKIIMLLLIAAITTCTVACNKDTEKDTNQENTTGENTENKNEESSEMELPNWRGIKAYYGVSGYIDGDNYGRIGIDISYPWLKPSSSGYWAYQWDPSLVLVTSPGLDKSHTFIKVNNLKETFNTSKEEMIEKIEYYRDYHYSNFDFIINTSEPMTINGLSTYKYTGKHTYTKDGTQQEIPFVAYSFDTKQIDNVYITVIVMDDSINNTSMKPLPKGTIEAYARKMVESIKVKDKLF